MTIRPGPRNAITDVDGIAVGSADDSGLRSGVTVVLPAEPAVAAVDTRGGAPGTHETDLLNPANLVDRVDAVALSGGSAFGLEAAAGVMGWLAARGRGFAVGSARVPIVPAAIIFDLLNGGQKDWGAMPPYRDLARRACDAAGMEIALGNVGAGFGAKAGKLKGGLGTASFVTDDGIQVGAVLVANPFGAVTIPGTGTLWGWELERDGEFGGQPAPRGPIAPGDLDYAVPAPVGGQTTIGVVATNVALTKAQATRIAIMAQDGLARAIRPVHTPLDGDTIFVLSTGRRPLAEPVPLMLARIGMLAADCAARAIGRAVFHAESLGEFPSYRSIHGAALRQGK